LTGAQRLGTRVEGDDRNKIARLQQINRVLDRLAQLPDFVVIVHRATLVQHKTKVQRHLHVRDRLCGHHFEQYVCQLGLRQHRHMVTMS
jgi:hypothetical protein